MTLITRIARLFRADLHAVLDRIEEPDVLLRQAVREMEDVIDGEEQQLSALSGGDQRLEGRMSELSRNLAALESELDLCFANGREDLARTLIRRRLENQRLLADLEHRREALAGERKGLIESLGEHRRELEDIRQRAESLDRGATYAGDKTSGASIGDDEIELAFLRERQKRGQS